MTTKRAAALFAVLLGGLGSVLFLPKQLYFQPLGVKAALPDFVGEWFGSEEAVSDKERLTLGPETDFSRKSYTNGRGDVLHVTIVLSGQDMNTSIHRPERCLPAQGWTISDKRATAVAVDGFGVIRPTRLHNLRSQARQGEKPRTIYNLDYYWFVGHTDVTGSHYERTWIDMRDRLLHGYNQRWAYISIASTITKDLQPFGRDEKQTDELIQAFIKQLVPMVHLEPARQG